MNNYYDSDPRENDDFIAGKSSFAMEGIFDPIKQFNKLAGLATNPALAAASKIAIFSSDINPIGHITLDHITLENTHKHLIPSMANSFSIGMEGMGIPHVINDFMNDITKVSNTLHIGCQNIDLTIPVGTVHATPLGFENVAGLVSTLGNSTSYFTGTQVGVEPLTLRSPYSVIETDIAKINGLIPDFSSKYTTINPIKTHDHSSIMFASEFTKAMEPLSELASSAKDFMVGNSIATRIGDSMKSYVSGIELTMPGFPESLKSHSFTIASELNSINGICHGILGASVKADYLNASPGEFYGQTSATLFRASHLENRLEKFGNMILSRIDTGLFSSFESETEFVEKDGKNEYHYHFHVHVTVDGNHNIIGNLNTQNIYKIEHE